MRHQILRGRKITFSLNQVVQNISNQSKMHRISKTLKSIFVSALNISKDTEPGFRPATRFLITNLFKVLTAHYYDSTDKKILHIPLLGLSFIFIIYGTDFIRKCSVFKYGRNAYCYFFGAIQELQFCHLGSMFNVITIHVIKKAKKDYCSVLV